MLDGQGWHFQTSRCMRSKNELKIKCEYCWKMSSALLTWSDFSSTESWTVEEIDKVKKFGSERSSVVYWSLTLTISHSVHSACEEKKENLKLACYVRKFYGLHYHWDSRECWTSGFIWPRSLSRRKDEKTKEEESSNRNKEFHYIEIVFYIVMLFCARHTRLILEIGPL